MRRVKKVAKILRGDLLKVRRKNIYICGSLKKSRISTASQAKS